MLNMIENGCECKPVKAGESFFDTLEGEVNECEEETMEREKTKVPRNKTNCIQPEKHDSDGESVDHRELQEIEDNGKGKKLKSGKCSKPDEVGILRTVRFPHEKLDSRHTQNKVFDKLPFNLLIAGELETIALPNILEAERSARVRIAKTVCYHKNYLEDEELHNGYDDIMKRVEQGLLDWSDELADKLHEHYVFRANVNLHSRLENEGFTKVEWKRKEEKMENIIEKAQELERIVYCQEYNKKSCLQQDHHEGRFMNKRVMKWHLCNKCLRVGEKRSHPSADCARGNNS